MSLYYLLLGSLVIACTALLLGKRLKRMRLEEERDEFLDACGLRTMWRRR